MINIAIIRALHALYQIEISKRNSVAQIMFRNGEKSEKTRKLLDSDLEFLRKLNQKYTKKKNIFSKFLSKFISNINWTAIFIVVVIFIFTYCLYKRGGRIFYDNDLSTGPDILSNRKTKSPPVSPHRKNRVKKRFVREKVAKEAQRQRQKKFFDKYFNNE